ncbi:MAG: Trk system potassium transporter TrkA [Fidelibacterota bacterium]
MKIVIIGAGEVGFHLARGLSEENLDITLIDIDPAKVQRASETLDVIVVHGDGASPRVLREADIQHADIVVAVTRVDEVNLIASQMAHQLGARRIIARLRNTEYTGRESVIHPERFGIDKVIHPELAATREIIRLVMQTAASSVVEFEGGRLQLMGIRLGNGSPVIGKDLGTVRRDNSDFHFSAVAVMRGQDTLIPHGETQFELNDICYFLVTKEHVRDLLKMTGKPYQETRNAMILGGGKIGRALARRLQDRIHLRLVEEDREKALRLASELEKTLVLTGDGTDIEFLRSENVEDLDSYIAVTQSEQTNLLSALLVKHLGTRQTLVHVSTAEYIPVLKLIGIDGVISKNMCTVKAILETIKSDQHVVITDFEDIAVEALEFRPVPGSKVTREALNRLKFPEDCIVGAINHQGHVFIPTGDTRISEDDIVLVFSLPQSIPKVEKLFT